MYKLIGNSLIVLFSCLIFSAGVWSVSAQEESDGAVQLKVVASDSEKVELQIGWEISKDAPGYDLTLKYDGPLKYDHFSPGNGKCTPNVQSNQKDTLSIFCLMSPGEYLEKEAVLGNVAFEVERVGEATFSVTDPDFGRLNVDGATATTKLHGSGGSIATFLSQITVYDLISWLGGIAALTFVALVYIHMTKQHKKSKSGQIVFIGVGTMFVLAGTAATIISFSGSFDSRGSAHMRSPETPHNIVCEPKCRDGESCVNGECVPSDNHGGGHHNPNPPVPPPPPGPPPVDPRYACSADTDCVKISPGCCGCNAGGKEISVNKEFAQQIEAEAGQDCGDTSCAQVFLCTDSVPVCVNNKCDLTEGNVKSEKPGDLNGDGKITINDYRLFLEDYLDWKYNQQLADRSDLNDDGRISIADYALFVELYVEANGLERNGNSSKRD